MIYFYLHGFASGPQSTKAVDLGDRFHDLTLDLRVPDLNQGDFFNLTLTRQIHQVQAAFPSPPEAITLIGSSFGGLTAAWVAQQQPQVQRLILLAPAFEFLSRWLSMLGEAQVKHWQTQTYLEFYHYSEQRQLPLSYQFVEDLAQYADEQLQRPVPTLILHGTHDDIIPIKASRNFVARRPWVRLIELDSDHSLSNVKAKIWEAVKVFCQLA
jgi:pimeloyl-ACP methyl ester carboxylesterase